MSRKHHGPYSKICLAIREINNGKRDFYFSRRLIKNLKAKGELNNLFDEKEITKNFEELLREFLTVLENPNLKNYKYFRKFWLYNKNNFTLCCKKYDYELGAYFSDNNEIDINENFNNFPWLFKKACSKFEIEPYASMSEEELTIFLNDYLDLADKDLMHPNLSRSSNSGYKSFSDRTAMYHSKNVEKAIYNSIKKDKAWLVSRNGDGYGYDIIVYKKKEHKERLIEVKSSLNDDSFRLSRLEHKLMFESSNLPNTEYLICKYNETTKKFFVYKYDKEQNILVDIKDKNHICSIEGYMDYERESRTPSKPRIKFMCTPKYLDNKKSLLLK